MGVGSSGKIIVFCGLISIDCGVDRLLDELQPIDKRITIMIIMVCLFNGISFVVNIPLSGYLSQVVIL